MIIYYSSWGIGNEFFQYAYLRSISKENEKIFCLGGMQELKEGVELNDSNFFIYTPGRVINSVLRILLFPTLVWLAKKRVFNLYEHRRNDKGFYLYKNSKKKGLIPINFLETDFFQCEYILDFNKIHFELKKKFIQQASEIFSSFPNGRKKVFVHLRRGDYLKETFNNQKGVNLPFSYYKSALEMIKKDIRDPYFIFLSDDSDYVEQAFRHISESDKYISTNHPLVDLALMSLCEYGICSNSTFSWWGSYLMKKKEKVIFPKYWYGWKTKVESHPGIQPSWSSVIEVR
ncbi:alpha-1,2-fucosyltransferase [Pseudothioglobus sp. nBUS_23]|uniref:alpha-1,2-fucosyltransferase n=1 Tax=Pseudothioglobus sp. nBUS_23 TaxID=3395318 RepID=UPI003EBAAE01